MWNMIKKVKDGYVVVSHRTGKRLSKPGTRAEALADLRRIKHFAAQSTRLGMRHA